MSALSTLIESAVSASLAEHTKLFDPKNRERAQKVLVRDIMKALTREPRGEGEEQPADIAPSVPALPERLPATDDRVKAYCNLRSLAGVAQPQRFSGGDIYLPPEGDTAAVRAFGNGMPSRDEWIFVTERAQISAWLEFFDANLPNMPRRRTDETRDGVVGYLLPWPWPPSKTGKVYEPYDIQAELSDGVCDA
jgi:hypothetical protein